MGSRPVKYITRGRWWNESYELKQSVYFSARMLGYMWCTLTRCLKRLLVFLPSHAKGQKHIYTHIHSIYSKSEGERVPSQRLLLGRLSCAFPTISATGCQLHKVTSDQTVQKWRCYFTSSFITVLIITQQIYFCNYFFPLKFKSHQH